mmetsp:Transcript_85169/g.238564  ORF Transcript_85169/g.238564 Transcript_85169/m.238564 type:complete len:332 (+) Transcript_85169:63-1058(+)
MGLVKKDADADKGDEVVPEDPPVVKTLKEIDDRYLAIEREYEKEIAKLQVAFAERQRPILEQRKELLATGDAANPASGTPGLAGFWLKALQNHPAFEDSIQEWDEPVLQYLTDIEKAFVDDEDTSKGFKLTFRFAENPYFTNSELVKEYLVEEENPYNGELDCKAVNATEISWKAGKDVTVEKPKVKGGGAKKAKQKAKVSARPSFFREFFRSLGPGCELSEDAVEALEESGIGDIDDPLSLQFLMSGDLERGNAIRENIVPFAVRWYTGEAIPEGYGHDDDDDDDEDDDDDDDDEDDEEDSDDEPPQKGRGGKARKGGGKGKGKKGKKKK